MSNIGRMNRFTYELFSLETRVYNNAYWSGCHSSKKRKKKKKGFLPLQFFVLVVNSDIIIFFQCRDLLLRWFELWTNLRQTLEGKLFHWNGSSPHQIMFLTGVLAKQCIHSYMSSVYSIFSFCLLLHLQIWKEMVFFALFYGNNLGIGSF